MNGVIVLVIYSILMIGTTILFTRKGKSTEEFHVGNRNMGTVSSAMSIAATWIWAPALFVSAEQAYRNGIAGLFWFVVPNILCLILFIPFAKRIRGEMPHGVTLSGYMGEKYNSVPVKRIYDLQLGALTILSTAVQLLAGGKILSTVMGIPFPVITIILAAIALSYSVISGIRASVLTDAIQMVFLLVACAVFIPWAMQGGGISDLFAGLGGSTGEYGNLFSQKGIEVALAFGIPTAIGLISGPFGDQCFWQRAFAIKKEKIGKAFFLGSIMFGIIPISMGLLGFIAAGSGFTPTDIGIVNLELVTHLFPKWAVLPFLLMLISGLLSTVDSNLCAIASLTTDFGVTGNKIPRIAMVVLLIAGIAIANIPGLTVTHMFLIYGTLRATTLLPTMFTLLKKRLTARGVAAGVLTALLVGLPIFAYGTLNNLSTYKTIGSLFTVLSAGIVACIISRLGAKK